MALTFAWRKISTGEEKVFDETTGYFVFTIGGFHIPPLDHIDVRGPRQHGSVYIDTFYQPRILSLSIYIIGTTLSDHEAKIKDLARLINPIDSGELLITTPSGAAFRLPCRISSAVEVVRESGLLSRALLQLSANDPFFRSATETTSDWTTAPGTGGLVIPFTIPFVISSEGNAVSEVLMNGGQVPTSPVIIINGPADNPALRNLTTNETLTVTVIVASGGSLAVDMGKRTVTLTNPDGSTVNVFDKASGAFWALNPGPNTIRYVTQSVAVMSGTIRFTDKFLAVI